MSIVVTLYANRKVKRVINEAHAEIEEDKKRGYSKPSLLNFLILALLGRVMTKENPDVLT